MYLQRLKSITAPETLLACIVSHWLRDSTALGQMICTVLTIIRVNSISFMLFWPCFRHEDSLCLNSFDLEQSISEYTDAFERARHARYDISKMQK